MRVLLACECSGRVREEFKKRGHYAMSCDLLDTEIPGNHYKGDVMDVIGGGVGFDDSISAMHLHQLCGNEILESTRQIITAGKSVRAFRYALGGTYK